MGKVLTKQNETPPRRPYDPAKATAIRRPGDGTIPPRRRDVSDMATIRFRHGGEWVSPWRHRQV